MSSAFKGCSNLLYGASDSPNLSNVTSMIHMFNGTASFNGDLSSWDVSNVTSMSYMFSNTSSFNGDISTWNTGNVISMSYMFNAASSFNGDLSNWNVSNVISMYAMFRDASLFNSNLSNWNVSNVTDMSYMFDGATIFNSDISTWNTGNATSMFHMFNSATNFNSDISNWDVSNVTNMSFMFLNASSFNIDLNNWNVGNVTDMSAMFLGASSFNRDLNNWDVSNVTSMVSMFRNASSFNGNLSTWDVSSVTSMSYMFADATVFNSDISNWNTINVSYMIRMFSRAYAFNSDLSNWNVGNVRGIDHMFYYASSFDSDLSNWNMTQVLNATNMLSYSGMSIVNYDASLIGWSKQILNPNVTLGGATYCIAKPERQYIIDTYNWTIYDINAPSNPSEVRGEMLTFDGIDDYVKIKDNISSQLTDGTFTVSAWCFANSNNQWGNIINNWGETLNGSLRLGFDDNSQKISISITQSDNTVVKAVASSDLVLNRWIHIAATADGTMLNLIIEGQIVASVPYDGTLKTSYPYASIGALLNDAGTAPASISGFWNGKIEEVRWFNSALSLSDIRLNMHRTLRGCEQKLIAYYQFENDFVIINDGITDISGSGYHGTAVNMLASNFQDSEVAVGYGSADILDINTTGLFNFKTSKVDILFATSPNGELVVTRITNESPHGASNLDNSDDEYFVIRNFGFNDTPEVNSITFKDITEIPIGTPLTDISLHKRASYEYGNTWGTAIANANSITDHSSATVTFTGIPLFSGFSQFVINNTGSTALLPVELLSFTGEQIENENHLLWITTSEINNWGFEIEKSADGKNWENIGFVEGNGNSLETHYYKYIDYHPFLGANYYRLKQYDFDGTYHFSNIVFIEKIQLNKINISPNPNIGEFLVTFPYLKSDENVNIAVYNVHGLEVHSEKYIINKGTDKQYFSLGNLPTGSYYFTIIFEKSRVRMSEYFIISNL